MRKTQLKQATAGVVIFTVSIAVLTAVLQVTVFSADETGVQSGAVLFEKKGCIQCHFTDSRKPKVGPGLEGLFQRDRLPASGRQVSEQNIRSQLKTPYKNMPSFADRLTDKQIDYLIDYLKTL